MSKKKAPSKSSKEKTPEKMVRFVWDDKEKLGVGDFEITVPSGNEIDFLKNLDKEEKLVDIPKYLTKWFNESRDDDEIYDEGVEYNLYKITIERIAVGKIYAKRDISTDVKPIDPNTTEVVKKKTKKMKKKVKLQESKEKVIEKTTKDNISDGVDLIDLY